MPDIAKNAKVVKPISDMRLAQVKITLDNGGVGISSEIVRSIIVRLENSELILGAKPKDTICANCRKMAMYCECEVFTASY